MSISRESRRSDIRGQRNAHTCATSPTVFLTFPAVCIVDLFPFATSENARNMSPAPLAGPCEKCGHTFILWGDLERHKVDVHKRAVKSTKNKIADNTSASSAPLVQPYGAEPLMPPASIDIAIARGGIVWIATMLMAL